MKKAEINEQILKCSGGNRCGHDRLHPILKPKGYIPPENLPAILKTASENFRKFYQNQLFLPALVYGRHAPIQKHHRKDSPFTNRKMRSEMREALCRLVTLLLSMTDLTSLRVGFADFQRGGFVLPDVKWMAEKTGMDVQRVIRARRILADAGYITITPRAEVVNDEYFTKFRGRTSVCTITEKFFLHLGIKLQAIKNERKKASKRARQKMDEWIAKNGDGFLTLAKYLSIGSGGRKKKKTILENSSGQPIWRPKTPEDFLEIDEFIKKLWKEHPEIMKLPDSIRKQYLADLYIQQKMGVKFPPRPMG